MVTKKTIVALWPALLLVAASAGAQDSGIAQEPAPRGAQASAMAAAIQSYWTAERMAEAVPMPLPTYIVDVAAQGDSGAVQQGELGAAGYAVGCNPKKAADGSCNGAVRSFGADTSAEADASAQPMHGTKPTTNPKNGPYGPFSRMTSQDAITTYPRSPIGKLFFTLNAKNYVCSASVIGRSTVATAGHCNSDGAGHFATNRLFCPSWHKGAADATRGCWSVNTSFVSSRWHSLSDPDYDYTCLVMNTTGTKQANKIGNVTGWLGRAWNWGPSQPERSFGYPAGSPFTGGRLIEVASTEWYTHDFVSGGQISKLMGNDMTGGSSGGPWVLGLNNTGSEVADTDASGVTDPGNNSLNGVNSHKRCIGNCNTPPTTTTGVFWQEMSSPPFAATTGDAGESEDVFASCLAHANNNP